MESNKALQKGGDETRLLKSIPNKKYFFTFTRTINSCSGYSVIFTAFLPSQRASVSRKEEHEEHYCVNKDSKYSGYEREGNSKQKRESFLYFFLPLPSFYVNVSSRLTNVNRNVNFTYVWISRTPRLVSLFLFFLFFFFFLSPRWSKVSFCVNEIQN